MAKCICVFVFVVDPVTLIWGDLYARCCAFVYLYLHLYLYLYLWICVFVYLCVWWAEWGSSEEMLGLVVQQRTPDCTFNYTALLQCASTLSVHCTVNQNTCRLSIWVAGLSITSSCFVFAALPFCQSQAYCTVWQLCIWVAHQWENFKLCEKTGCKFYVRQEISSPGGLVAQWSAIHQKCNTTRLEDVCVVYNILEVFCFFANASPLTSNSAPQQPKAQLPKTQPQLPKAVEQGFRQSQRWKPPSSVLSTSPSPLPPQGPPPSSPPPPPSPPFPACWWLPRAVTPGSRTNTVVEAIILCSSSSRGEPEPEDATDLTCQSSLCYYPTSSIVSHQARDGLSKDLESVWGSLTQRLSAQSATAQTRMSHCKKSDIALNGRNVSIGYR